MYEIAKRSAIFLKRPRAGMSRPLRRAVEPENMLITGGSGMGLTTSLRAPATVSARAVYANGTRSELNRWITNPDP